MTKSVDAVLKADVLGRVKMPAEKRQRLLEEFDRSGLSGKQYAALVGVNYQTFAGWLHQRRKSSGGIAPPHNPGSKLQWLQAVVSETQLPSAPVSVLKVHLPGGAWMEIAQSEQVTTAAALVRALQQPSVSC